MQKQYYVNCVSKDDNGNITHIGGDGHLQAAWKKSVNEVIVEIEQKKQRYVVMAPILIENCPNWVSIVVIGENGNKYIRTESDDTIGNNLDSLPACV